MTSDDSKLEFLIGIINYIKLILKATFMFDKSPIYTFHIRFKFYITIFESTLILS